MKSEEEIRNKIKKIRDWISTAEDLPDVTNKRKWQVTLAHLIWVLNEKAEVER